MLFFGKFNSISEESFLNLCENVEQNIELKCRCMAVLFKN